MPWRREGRITGVLQAEVKELIEGALFVVRKRAARNEPASTVELECGLKSGTAACFQTELPHAACARNIDDVIEERSGDPAAQEVRMSPH